MLSAVVSTEMGMWPTLDRAGIVAISLLNDSNLLGPFQIPNEPQNDGNTVLSCGESSGLHVGKLE